MPGMEFDPHIALGYARAITRPRRAGSDRERVVAREITGRLERSGYRVERQPFRFSTAPTLIISLEVLVCLLLVLAASGLRVRAPSAAAAPAVLLVLLILFTGPINRAVLVGSLAPAVGKPSLWPALCLGAGTRYGTENLIATLPEVAPDLALPHLYLVAHYDSKSQQIPLIARVLLFVAAIIGGLSFAALTLLAVAFPVLTPAATAIGIVAMLAGLPLLILDIGDASPGAIDNASSVGLVVHLAEHLASDSRWRDKLRVTILLTSAEEMTVMGGEAYARENEPALRRQAEAGGLYVLNLDGIGVDGKLYLAGGLPAGKGADRRQARRLADLVRRACGELGITVERFGLPGVMFDHMPFARRELDAVSLIAVGPATRFVHTPQDTADKLDVRGFEQAGRVILKVIERLCES